MSVLADPIFSREQCSSGSLCMRWHPAPPIRLLHTFCAQGGGQAPTQIFTGGPFYLQGGASLGQISILKIIIFLMIFLSFFGIFI